MKSQAATKCFTPLEKCYSVVTYSESNTIKNKEKALEHVIGRCFFFDLDQILS